MTTHDDPVARAIREAHLRWLDGDAKVGINVALAQAAERAVLKLMREMVKRKSVIVNNYATSGDYIRNFLDAYEAERNIK